MTLGTTAKTGICQKYGKYPAESPDPDRRSNSRLKSAEYLHFLTKSSEKVLFSTSLHYNTSWDRPLDYANGVRPRYRGSSTLMESALGTAGGRQEGPGGYQEGPGGSRRPARRSYMAIWPYIWPDMAPIWPWIDPCSARTRLPGPGHKERCD